MKYKLLLGLLGAFLAGNVGAQSVSKVAFIEQLLSKMTLEEKCGQLHFPVGNILTGPAATKEVTATDFDDAIRKGQVTGVFNTNGVKNIKHLQEVAVKESRLGIPLLIGADVIHGFKTVFPIPLAEAASWDLKAIERSARVSALESSATGINWTFAPMVDISLDARWGRVAEGAGEDPFLGSCIAAARVRGFQGQSLSSGQSVAACIKHFAAYGAGEAGRDYNTVDMSERRLRETFLPPYKAGIDAGAATVMTSFNEFDGVPASANRFLMDKILRKEWGFEGVLVSDWMSIAEMISHGFSANRADAGQAAMIAGVDMDMVAAIYSQELPKLVREGKVPIAAVDAAVRRTLSLKYDLGLFQNPFLYCDTEREQKVLLSPENRAAARDMARKSIVLLKNQGNVLPLSASVKNIALIGPLATNRAEHNGMWALFGDSTDVVPIDAGFREVTKAAISTAQGCDFYSNDKKGFQQAVAVAQKADVVVLAVGESAVMSGEGASRSDIRLPGAQEDLVRAIVATGKPVVLLVFHGRPLDLSFLETLPPSVSGSKLAVVACWALGTETGHAVADVVFGAYNPSGRLPMAFPRSVGQLPFSYRQKATGRPYGGDYSEAPTNRMYQSRYRDVKNTPLFPFGFGLSYTTFKYDTLLLDKTEMALNDTITVTTRVTNTGKMAGEEVVQLYLHDAVGSVTRPTRELKGFEKIELKPGESKWVSFKITSDMLSFYRQDMSWGAEKGRFTVFVGPHSETTQGKDFYLK